ncbi:MAG: FAD binding domain-containing protein [Acidimicrobiales bacterium]
MAADGSATTFVVPTSVEEAVAALSDPDAVALAGGTSIGLLVGQGLLVPGTLVWLGRIPELREIAVHDDRVVLGAGVTLSELSAHPALRRDVPALAVAAGLVGNTRVRAVATIGGALVHADPRQDVPVALLALDARVAVTGPDGTRSLAVDELLTGFMSTALAAGEVVTAVTIPLRPRTRSCYHRFTPGSVDDYPTVAVGASVTLEGGSVTAARVAVGGAGSTAYAVSEAAWLVGSAAGVRSPAVEAVAAAAARRADPVADRLGSTSYKREMVAVWVRRALVELLDFIDSADPADLVDRVDPAAPSG